MRILFIHTYYRNRGGEDSVCENEMALLKEQGHDVHSLFFYNRKNKILNFLLLPFNIFSYWKVKSKIREVKPEIVHIHNFFFFASPAIIKAVKKMNAKCVVTLHNFRIICPSATLFHKNHLYFKSLRKSFPWAAIKDRVYRNSMLLTFWVAFSFWVAKKIKTWNAVDIFLVPNQYARNTFTSHASHTFADKMIIKQNFINDPGKENYERGNSYLYVGRLSEEKGIHVLLEAQKMAGFPLVIIGDGPLRKEVTKSLASQPNLVFLGPLENKQVMDHIKRTKALIVPSTCMEMNPLVMIEAMACGTPVITSDVDTLKEFVISGYNGETFRLNDAASLIDTIQQFSLRDDQSIELISSNARETYERYFSKRNTLNLLEKTYNGLLKLAISIPITADLTI